MERLLTSSSEWSWFEMETNRRFAVKVVVQEHTDGRWLVVDREGDQSSLVSKVCSRGHARNMRNEIS